MAKQDYYATLGVSKDASEQDIKRAYRRLAREHHPDVNQGDPKSEERFKEIGEAYKVLSNPEARAQYDQYGHAAFDGAGGGGFDPFGGMGGAGGFGGFEDIFDAFFGGGGGGGGRARQGPLQGADLRVDLTLSFEEAAEGVKTQVDLVRTEKCSRCHGNQAEPGTPIKDCGRCGGSGEVRQARQTPFGQFVNVQPCSQCHGQGKLPETPCKECGGAGRVRRRASIPVTIPAGVDDGNRVRVAGQGDAGERGGPAGDLYVFVTVRPHDFFKRDGNHLYCDIPVSFVQAALGDEIDVPTLRGSVKMKIAEGTQSGTRLRLKGQGVADPRGHGKGDQFVTIKVVTPTRLSAEQKELLIQFSDLSGDAASGSADDKGFFGRVKDALKGHG